MKTNCGHCGQSFKAKRIDASWCSARCRVAHHRRMRNAGVTDIALLNLDDGVRQLEGTLAGVQQLQMLSTCAGWSDSEASAFECVQNLLKSKIAELRASRESVAAGGAPVAATCAV